MNLDYTPRLERESRDELSHLTLVAPASRRLLRILLLCGQPTGRRRYEITPAP